jgi:GT2 family glycosyltransferase
MIERPRVTIIIPTFRRITKLNELLKSVEQSHYQHDKLEIIVVVDGDKIDYTEIIKSYPDVKFIISSEERYASYSRNVGARSANGKYLFFVDDDNVLDPECIDVLVSEMERRPETGIAAPIMLFKSKPDYIWCAGADINRITMRHRHIGFKKLVSTYHGINCIECEYVPNSYFVRSDEFAKIGRLDEKHFPFALEEVDLALRYRKNGKKVMVFPSAKTWHDIPFDDDVHVGGRRAYFRGRSRVMFYLIHAPWHILVLPKDIVGFSLTTIQNSNDKINDMIKFFQGMVDGFIYFIGEK